MKLVDLNFERDIGANSMFVQVGPFNLVIDSGSDPKRMGRESLPDFSRIPVDSIDYILISHCHLDHIGSLPVLHRIHKNATILMSEPSAVILPKMLYNSFNVMCKQREEKNDKDLPLFKKREIEDTLDSVFTMKFEKTFVFKKNKESMEITFFSAGHVLGASGIQIEYKHRKIFFTGDVLFRDQETLKGASFPKGKIDSLVMETTCGCKERPDNKSPELEQKKLVNLIQETIKRGGSCLIPVFALGRMQEILTIIHQAIKNRKIDHVPIICSGLGIALVDSFEEIARKTRLVNFRKKILKDLKIRPFQSKNAKPGQSPKKPMIFVLSSGMLVENTPSYQMAASLIEDHKNSIAFVGYCAPETPGGQLMHKTQGTNFLFETLKYNPKIKATVESFDLSGHADRDELVNLVKKFNPRATVLSHGNKLARNWFFNTLGEQNPSMKIVDPEPGFEHLI